jgi:hypothetical protein
VDDYVDRLAKRGDKAFYEHQIKYATETYGNIAHLWSTYTVTETPRRQTDRSGNQQHRGGQRRHPLESPRNQLASGDGYNSDSYAIPAVAVRIKAVGILQSPLPSLWL